MFFFLIALPPTAHVQVLPFVCVATKMNEEEERATLENFVDSSILELLLNETKDEKDIVHKIGNHMLLTAILGINWTLNGIKLHLLRSYNNFHPLFVQDPQIALKSSGYLYKEIRKKGK